MKLWHDSYVGGRANFPWRALRNTYAIRFYVGLILNCMLANEADLGSRFLMAFPSFQPCVAANELIAGFLAHY